MATGFQTTDETEVHCVLLRPATSAAARRPERESPANDSRSPISNHHSPASALRRRGFTLIEILTVIAIIGILLSIAVTAGRGIQERGRIAKAKAEMAVIATALEQYKQHYGDYPWTPEGLTAATGETNLDGGVILFNAMTGGVGPKINPPLAVRGRAFVELSKFQTTFTASANLPDPNPAAAPVILYNWFADPWGKWYWYSYRKSATDTDWLSPGFLLYSHGPDGECNLGPAEASGFLTEIPGDAINADNIYYGRN